MHRPFPWQPFCGVGVACALVGVPIIVTTKADVEGVVLVGIGVLAMIVSALVWLLFRGGGSQSEHPNHIVSQSPGAITGDGNITQVGGHLINAGGDVHIGDRVRAQQDFGEDVRLTPRVQDNWALVDVSNWRTVRSTFRAEAKIISGTSHREELYPVRWRETDTDSLALNGNGGHGILNLAEASLPRGRGPYGFVSLRYSHFDFHTARIPIGGGQVSERFGREQERDDGIIVFLAITADPPLSEPIRKFYRLRSTEEPDTFEFDMSTPDHLVEAALEEAQKRVSPKIEFVEITSKEVGLNLDNAGL